MTDLRTLMSDFCPCSLSWPEMIMARKGQTFFSPFLFFIISETNLNKDYIIQCAVS